MQELKSIDFESQTISIGGLTTWTQIIQAKLPRCFHGLKAAAREIGGVQIQNRGTIAGNLCNASPAADSVPPLLALDAEVELFSRAGSRRIPLAEFIVGNRKTVRRNDEILARVLVPRAMENAASTFLKLGARHYLVISIVMVAVVMQTDEVHCVKDLRVSVGSCSAWARRLRALERDLAGAAATTGLGKRVTTEHLRDLSPIDDVRATAVYRQDAALRLVQRALAECARMD